MELEGLKVNFLGDSITEGAGTTAPEFRFVNVFARKTGATVRNYGIGGTRIGPVRHTMSRNPRWDLHYLDRVEGMDVDADLVVIFGGTNDFGHGDGILGSFEDEDEYTFYGAMKSLCRRVINRYPTSRIVIMTPLHRASEAVVVNELGLPCRPLSEYVRAEREVAEYFSLPVLDLWSVSGIQPCDPVLRTTYTADGLHPNNRGAERIADCLIGFLGAL